jgi:hypothetical protein
MGHMAPTVAADAPASVTPRIWPITTALVVSALLLMAYQLAVCVLYVYVDFLGGLMAAFDPKTPLNEDHIPAGMACLTTLPAFAAMIWCGWQRGSRRGLLLFGVPAAVMALVGLNLLNTPSVNAGHSQPVRALSIADPFADPTGVNWVVAALFVGCAVVTLLLRQRARHTESGSAA